MKKCNHCGAELEQEETVCPSCGQAVAEETAAEETAAEKSPAEETAAPAEAAGTEQNADGKHQHKVQYKRENLRIHQKPTP